MRNTGLPAALLLSLATLFAACDDDNWKDRIGPRVLWTAPADGETGVPVMSPVIIQFDEALARSTAVAENFQLGNTAPGLVTYDIDHWQVVLHPPDPAFNPGDTVDVVVSEAIKDTEGNRLAVEVAGGELEFKDYTFSYTISDDVTPPEVTDVVPADGSTDVGLTRALEIIFSEALDPGTVGTRAVQANGGEIHGVLEYQPPVGEEPARLSFQPEGGWPAATEVTVELSTDITDLAGNKLIKIQSINFTTASS